MSLQPTLPVAPRAHDLPPRWDGRRVEWGQWDTTRVIICPPPKPEPCHVCGSTEQPATCRGAVRSAPGEVVPIRRPRSYTDALENQRAEQRGVVLLTLVATRCPDCLTDQVWEPRTDAWWDLDDSDYGDEGSYQR